MSSQFWRLCKANLLLFISVYALLPVLIIVATESVNIFIAQAAWIYLSLVFGRIVSGFFTSYLVDSFKRKHVCLTGWVVVILTTVFYFFTDNFYHFLLLAFLQGFTFGIVSSSLVVLSTDLVATENRTRGNLIFGSFSRGGMVVGIALGSFLILNWDFDLVVYLSLLTGLLGMIYVVMVHVPFRAPIGTSLISLDRFFLPRSWILVLNLILVGIVFGVFVPLIHYEVDNLLIMSTGWVYPFYVFLFAGFVLTFLFSKRTTGIKWLIVAFGLLVVAVSVFILSNIIWLSILAAFLMGMALALITPCVLNMFIDLSSHCERVSANITNALSWDVGMVLGIVISCYFKDSYSSLAAYHAALLSATLAFSILILLTVPYYRKRKPDNKKRSVMH